MTVSELIERLKLLPPELPVMLCSREGKPLYVANVRQEWLVEHTDGSLRFEGAGYPRSVDTMVMEAVCIR